VRQRTPRVGNTLTLNGISHFSPGTILAFDVIEKSFLVLEICPAKNIVENKAGKWTPQASKTPAKPFVLSFEEYEAVRKNLPKHPQEVPNDVFINQKPFS